MQTHIGTAPVGVLTHTSNMWIKTYSISTHTAKDHDKHGDNGASRAN
jgi:hypothetical protein